MTTGRRRTASWQAPSDLAGTTSVGYTSGFGEGPRVSFRRRGASLVDGASRENPSRIALPQAPRRARESGGIGRRTSLRSWRGSPWGFESPLSHHDNTRASAFGLARI